ncbi:hypothetical protein Trydic_g19225 [Trypoxylus dichotomus]
MFPFLKPTYEDDDLSCTRCYKWFARFKGGRDPIEGGKGFSTPIDDTHTQKIKDLVHSSFHLTVRELAEEICISIGSCLGILTEKLKSIDVCSNVYSLFDYRTAEKS